MADVLPDKKSILHIKALGGSMRPLIKSGQTVLVEIMSKQKKINIGDVVAYRSNSKLLLHRAIWKSGKGITINDDTWDVGPHLVSEEDIIGKVLLPFWAKGFFGLIYNIVVSFLFFSLRPVKRFFSSYFFLFLFCQVFIVSSVLTASSWSNLGPFGGRINKVVISPYNTNVIYAASEWGEGLFKTTNAGTSWQSIGDFKNISIMSLALDPGNPNIIYAGASNGSGIFKSIDGGTTWSTLEFNNEGPEAYSVQTIAVTAGNVVLAGIGLSGSGGWIYRSADGGMTWTKVFPSTGTASEIVNEIAVDPTDSGIIWAVTGDYLSDTEGEIYRSVDGGITWVQVGAGKTSGWLNTVAVKNISTALVGGKNGAYKTVDAGINWTSVLAAGTSSCLSIKIDSTDTNVVYAVAKGTSGERFYKSTCTADTWITQVTVAEVNCFRSIAINPNDTDEVYAGDDGSGMFKSVDGGTNWTKINSGLNGCAVFDIEFMESLSRIYISAAGGIYYTDDFGSTWKSVHNSEGRSSVLKMHPGNSSIFYAGFDNGDIYRYNWNGTGFTSTKLNFNTANSSREIVYGIDINSSDTDVIYAATGKNDATTGHLFKTENGGQDWVSAIYGVSSPVNVVKINPADPDILFLGAGDFSTGKTLGGLWRYSNADWELIITGGIITDIVIDSSDPLKIYASAGGYDAGIYKGIYISRDGGNTWSEASGIPATGEGFSSICIDPGDRDIIYATGGFDFYRSLDSGQTWSREQTDAHLYGMVTASQSIFVASSKGMLKFSGFSYNTAKKLDIYNFPNPFDMSKYRFTTIKYSLPESAHDVKVGIYTIDGRLVKEWEQNTKEGGYSYFISWNGENDEGRKVSSGLYIMVLDADGDIKRNKIAIIK
ncbi:MAG: hypothetical protein JW983_03745 [Elusimicrobia bacterium]|nr:hypothetical protein [Elusimicrobiota bacterium]